MAGQALQGSNHYGTMYGTRSFATKHSFSTDKGLCFALNFLTFKLLHFAFKFKLLIEKTKATVIHVLWPLTQKFNKHWCVLLDTVL